jgi:hypothetical protein
MTTKDLATRTQLAPAVAVERNVTFDQMERMAQAIAKSGLFGVKTADQALALMVVAHAEGKHPALIARDFDIIQGRPAKKSDAMLRDFHAAGGEVEWHELTDTKADATFSHPKGGTIRIAWDLPRADKAGLTQKEGSMYKKYPRAMLRARCVSEGCRTIWPSSTSGMYTPEEGADIPETVNITPLKESAAIDAAITAHNALTDEERAEHSTGIKGAKSLEQLTNAFAAAWKHASDAKDAKARTEFKAGYDARRAELDAAQENSNGTA